jgi:hypothetical protein
MTDFAIRTAQKPADQYDHYHWKKALDKNRE